MYQKLIGKESKLAVIGLGYVGLPIALGFAKKIKVIGFDINAERVAMMRKGIDPSNELTAEEFENSDIHFTDNIGDLKDANFFIVAVPTPVDQRKQPDLLLIKKASETVGKVIKKGDYVVYESTVYPGCTEEDCLPIIEKLSGLKMGVDFKLGYSPERINPGDKEHTFSNIIKVVSGCDKESLDVISKVYEIVVDAGTYPASSIKVAEACKIIENTQRDLNIALMNELSIIFDKMNINTFEVLEAAETKWNFLKFHPGLIGGHCIGIDPYYLTHKSEKLGYNSKVILAGRIINDEMPAYVAKKVIQHIIKNIHNVNGGKILIMGVTFKENVSDVRNSKVAELIKELQAYSLSQIDVVDPCADTKEMEQEYDIHLSDKVGTDYDVVLVAVAHKEYKVLDQKYFKSIMNQNALLMDLKGIYRKDHGQLNYWSL
jgi:UDP-N-acetyl-D-galactosamine dehydrogenase